MLVEHANGPGPVALDTPIELRLLGRFGVRAHGDHVEVAPSGQRVLACIALAGGSANRTRIASTLWPDSSDRRAAANLRGAVYRLPEPIAPELRKERDALAFSSRWRVDVDHASEAARRLRDGKAVDDVDRDAFASDLLPDWLDNDWLLVERERHRQLRLHALEDLAAAQLAAQRALDAVDTALEAVSSEPLRESAQLLLLRAHLLAGNRAAAAQRYRDFRALLRRELEVEPSAAMQDLIARAGIGSPTAASG